MVNIKQRALRALRKYREDRTQLFESGHVQGIHAGPYVLGGIDWAAGRDHAVFLMQGTFVGQPQQWRYIPR